MQVILKQDVKGLGFKHDVVKVRNGYGLNFLIPQGLAVVAGRAALNDRAEAVRQAEYRQEGLRNAANELAEKLGQLTVKLAVRTGENRRIFGTVTTLMVAESLTAMGYDVDRRKMSIRGEIRELGTYQVEAELYRDIKAVFQLEVTEQA
ncbi:MAG: 50S ribosomal protein L9 [Bacteroidota bacterium]|jgi:large subunit ribosomal protein L9